MPLCLFCETALDDTTEPEHVLLNALGGRKTTKWAICSGCNNTFGGSIDKIFAEQIVPIRNLLQLKSGTGENAPGIRNVQAGPHKLNIKGDGTPEIADKPFTVETLSDASWKVGIKVNSEDELNRYVPNIAAKLKIPEESLRQQLVGAEMLRISERPKAGHQLTFGGPDALRSMVKSALVLWSTLVGNEEVRSAPYADALQFVRAGGEAFNKNRTHLDSRYVFSTDNIKGAFGPIFNLLYMRSDDDGQVIGHFTLYNLLGWQFVLAENGGTPNRKIGLVSNPEYPGQWSDDVAELFDIPIPWLNEPDYSDVRAKARIEALLHHYVESRKERCISGIIDKCGVSLSLAPDQPLTPEQQDQLIKLASYRLVHYALDLPYVEKVSPEQIAEIVREK
ncbi:MAG: HNH endonuclease [Roseiarcus sp.]